MGDVPNFFDLKYTFKNGVTMNVVSTQPRIMFYGTKGCADAMAGAANLWRTTRKS